MSRIFTASEIRIPHTELVRLRQDGKVSLGISKPLAERISHSPDLKPTKTTAAAAFKIWNVLALLGFIYSIYLSFTAAWWWFIVGFIAAATVTRANTGANQENLLEAAMIDPDFYENVAALGGWHYKMAGQLYTLLSTDTVRYRLQQGSSHEHQHHRSDLPQRGSRRAPHLPVALAG